MFVFFGGGAGPFLGDPECLGGVLGSLGGSVALLGGARSFGGGGPGCLGGVVLDPFGGGPACVAPHPPTLPPSRRCSCLRLGPPQTSTPPNSPPRHPPIPLPPPSPACFCLFIPCCPTPHSPPILSSKSSPPPSPQPVPVSPNPPPPSVPNPPAEMRQTPPERSSGQVGPGGGSWGRWGGTQPVSRGGAWGHTAGVTGRWGHGFVTPTLVGRVTRLCPPRRDGDGDMQFVPRHAGFVPLPSRER